MNDAHICTKSGGKRRSGSSRRRQGDDSRPRQQKSIKARETHIVNGLTPDFSHGLRELTASPAPGAQGSLRGIVVSLCIGSPGCRDGTCDDRLAAGDADMLHRNNLPTAVPHPQTPPVPRRVPAPLRATLRSVAHAASAPCTPGVARASQTIKVGSLAKDGKDINYSGTVRCKDGFGCSYASWSTISFDFSVIGVEGKPLAQSFAHKLCAPRAHLGQESGKQPVRIASKTKPDVRVRIGVTHEKPAV
jgi:hypothetical protein